MVDSMFEWSSIWMLKSPMIDYLVWIFLSVSSSVISLMTMLFVFISFALAV